MGGCRRVGGRQWGSLKLFRQCCTSSEKTQQQLVRAIGATLLCVVSSCFNNFAFFAQQLLVPRDSGDKPVGRCFWWCCCRCGRCSIHPGHPLCRDKPFVCVAKVRKIQTIQFNNSHKNPSRRVRPLK